MTLTPERLFLLALAVAAFAVAMLVLVDSIRWRVKRRRNIRELREIGLNVSDEWLQRRR